MKNDAVHCIFIDAEERVVRKVSWTPFPMEPWHHFIRMAVAPELPPKWASEDLSMDPIDILCVDWWPFAYVETRPRTLYMAEGTTIVNNPIPRGLLRAATRHCTSIGAPGDALVVRPPREEVNV